MATDIRLDVDFPDHPKTVKLEKAVGLEGFKCLIRLWLFCRCKRPNGILSKMDKEDIEVAAKWKGEPDAFVNALLRIGWLDEKEGTYMIHDWEEHQPWAVGAEERSRVGRENAMKRWRKAKGFPNPAGKNKANGICEFVGCNNPANVIILGKRFCSIPTHRNSMFGGVLK